MEACTPASRPNRSLVMIDSISINIDAAEQSKSEKCDHFTIRGFVSDTRTENGTHFWPLSVNGNDANFEDINSRPHMDVPKFRRWQCQSCLREIHNEGALEDAVTTVKCSRRLKTKNYRFHWSLENVIAHLLKKSEQHPELVCARCKETESVEEVTQKQHVDPGKLIIPKGLGENELHSAASDCIYNYMQHVRKEFDNQLVTLTGVDEHQKQWLKSAPTAFIKVGITDGAKHSGRHDAGTKLVQNHLNHDDSGGTGRRKAKKVRLLNDLFDEDKKDVQPALTRGFQANKAAKVSLGQRKNKKCHEQDSRRSQMHNADSLDGKGAMRKAQDLSSTFADSEMQMASKDEDSGAIIMKADKMLLGSNHEADVQKNNNNRGQQRNIYSFRKQVFMSESQPFHGRAMDPQQNSITPSLQFKGKSIDTLEKVHQDVSVLTPADNSKEIDGNSVLKNPLVEKVQSGHQTQFVKDDHSSKRHYHFSDGCLDTRKGTTYYVPHTENRNLQNDFTMPYMGESRSVCKSLVEKNMWQRTKSNSGLKRPNQSSCIGNKKPKYSTRTEGLTVVHQTENLFGTSNKKVVGSQEIPKHSKNMMQEVGTSDDIPMEIVELMAKNLYERRLHEVGDNYCMPQSGSNPIRDVVGTSVLSNVVSAAVQNQKSYLPSHLRNTRVISEKGSGISNKSSNSNAMQRHTGNTNCPVLSSQGNLSNGFQSPSLGSSNPNLLWECEYDMNNLPSRHKVSPGSRSLHEEWQPASRRSDKSVHAWPMIPPNNPVHMLDACQGSGLHPFGVGKVPTCSSYVVEGRGLNNLNVAGFGHPTNNFRPEASSGSHPNRVNSRPQMTVSLNPCSNETLTAMHLVSLMDGGTQSSTLTNTEANANRKTFDRSFSNDHLARELSLNNTGVGKSNHKFKQPSPYVNQSSVIHSDASFKCSPPVPRFGSVVMSLPGDAGNKKGSLSHHQERTFLNGNAGASLLADKKNGLKSQKFRLACSSSVTGQELVPAHELSQHISGTMWCGSGSSHSYMNGNISGYCNFMPPECYHTLKGRAEPGACYVNRNPMDFTTPGPGNEYMIGTEELKFRNRIHYPYITGPIATNTHEQNKFASCSIANTRL